MAARETAPDRPAAPVAASGRVAPAGALRATRGAALVALLTLAGLAFAWELVLAPTGRGTLALKALPLLLPLPGIWRWRLYTFRWTSLMIWLYVTEGLVRATSEPAPGALLAAAEVALALIVFAACAAHVRLRLRNGRAADRATQAAASPARSPAAR